MKLLRYYCLVARTAFTHSLSITQGVLFFVIIAVGAAIWFAPVLHMTVDLMFATGGQAVAAITLGTIIGIRLL